MQNGIPKFWDVPFAADDVECWRTDLRNLNVSELDNENREYICNLILDFYPLLKDLKQIVMHLLEGRVLTPAEEEQLREAEMAQREAKTKKGKKAHRQAKKALGCPFVFSAMRLGGLRHLTDYYVKECATGAIQ